MREVRDENSVQKSWPVKLARRLYNIMYLVVGWSQKNN